MGSLPSPIPRYWYVNVRKAFGRPWTGRFAARRGGRKIASLPLSDKVTPAWPALSLTQPLNPSPTALGALRCSPPRSRSSLAAPATPPRSEEHTSELQSLMRISYAVFCLKKKNKTQKHTHITILKQSP